MTVNKRIRLPYRKLALSLTAAIATLAGLMGGGSWIWWQSAIAPLQPRQGQTPSQTAADWLQVNVPEGASAEEIGRILHQAGLIRSVTAWKVWTRWQGWRQAAGGFHAGTYRLSPQASLPDIAQTIWSGQVQQVSFTIKEGWSQKQMARYFEKLGWFSASDFLAATQRIPRDRYPWLPENIPFLEGYLFPETYQISVDQRTPEAVITVMLDHFQKSALPVYEKRNGLAELSLQDWVTLASIVEKEAAVASERPRIAGVFWNRLRQGITLGSDPTVEYGLGVTQTPDQPLTYAQVETPSPYNTYINAGLTPTPIASPGLASLKAVISPEKTDFLYFVARYDDTHVFSRTLAEHERAHANIRDRQDAQ
ncbi:MAG: endolytic transglycosylase MltG [Acaryochloris sp. RU_4_1]|nr:endolytic transglycosylase MltG [Acaryochloris sp. SU_5_25]NJM67703.1 endolytic transglycosylase MltG [Acaryochloris sp. RU_4_1]NJR56452.1 endolytic transglycosylase MltG [Acaryochloris sp. CRU_2_0]